MFTANQLRNKIIRLVKIRNQAGTIEATIPTQREIDKLFAEYLALMDFYIIFFQK